MMRSIFSGTFAPNSPINPVLSSICSLRAAQVGVYTNHPTYVCTEFQSDVLPNGFSCWSVLVCYLSVADERSRPAAGLLRTFGPSSRHPAAEWRSQPGWFTYKVPWSWVMVAEIAKGTRALQKNIHLPSAPPSADWQWHFEWPPTWISTWPPSSTRRSNGMCNIVQSLPLPPHKLNPLAFHGNLQKQVRKITSCNSHSSRPSHLLSSSAFLVLLEPVDHIPCRCDLLC